VTEEHIEGRRPVLEALRAGREISEILVLRTARGIDDIRRLAATHGVRVRELPKPAIERLAQTRSPQGVIAVVSSFHYAALSELVERADKADEPALFVALDGVTDPQNLGAIARSAEAAGAHGLLLPVRRSASVGAAAEKASAGALEHLPVAQVGNLARALAELKQSGIWIAALDSGAERTVFELDLATDPLCVVIGGEGGGVSRLVRERADAVARIPMSGRVESLNASAAAAVVLFEIRRRRGS
jgi:23S rRNA (guanosine2251-2'-O)-methyltransferase